MSLPKQVRQQIADAKRIESEMRSAETPVEPTPPPAPVNPETPVVAAPAPAPAPTPAPQPQMDSQHAELLQQYRTLQGIHRTLQRSNSELQSKAQGLQSQVSELSTEVEQLRAKVSAAPTPSVAPVTPEEIKEFGPDLISVIERKAQEVAAPLNQMVASMRAEGEALKQRNAELEQQLNGVTRTQAENAQARFQADLMRLVPDFNTLNFDSNFLSWLSQVDPLDARRRSLQERLNEAVEYGDAEAVAGFFNAFRKVVSAQPAPTPKVDLAAQAQPASRSAPDAAPAVSGRQWTGANIDKFYADVARGKYTPQEKQRIEREIFTAQKDNRIAA